jgi:putative phosphotransacetylase
MRKPVIIETSARHLHLCREDLDTLFGEGYQLNSKKELSQPGQFACMERVTIVGPKARITATILGPVRPVTQVELALTDTRTIGISAPVRESGHIEGSAGCKLVGPMGEVVLRQGVIVAKRHIHATPANAQAYGLTDRQIVQVRYVGDGRSVIYGDVVVRVSSGFALAMHVDTDESNAGRVASGAMGEILV